jgi:hypothetical protein
MSILSPCVNSNPDIAGIGVRGSIYTQALVNLAESALLFWDGVPEPDNHVIFESSSNLFITGCAVVASTIIQAHAAGQGLSVYHALIALNLGWINSLSGMQPIATTWAESSSRESLAKMVASPRRLASRSNFSHLLATMHLSAVAGVGIWVWTSIDTFGSQPECTPQTFLTLLGQDVLVAHVNAQPQQPMIGMSDLPMANAANVQLQTPMIGIYWVFVWPLINIGLFTSTVSMIISVAEVSALSFQYFSKRRFEIRGRRFIVLFCITMVEILFIVDTELMISRSSGTLVKEGEAEWSFGQVLAVWMAFFPLFELFKKVFSRVFRHHDPKIHDDLVTCPTPQSQSLVSVYSIDKL